MNLFPKKNRIFRSDLVSLLVEVDLEMADDRSVWQVVLACEGDSVPQYLGAGYLHPPGCECHQDGKLCNIGWTQEYINCVGEDSIIKQVDEKITNRSNRIFITGTMVSERFDEINGTDYDEFFEVLVAGNV